MVYHLTAGNVPVAVVRMLGYDEEPADELVEAGLWDSKPDGKKTGYVFHDWEIYQPSSVATKEKRDEVSRKRAEAGRRGAEKRWSQTDGKPDGKLPSAADGNEIAPSRPVPSSSSTKKSVGASRRKPEIPMPDDWVPKPSHVAFALERGVDGRHEEGQFRAWAASKDARYRDWDAAFRGWLGRANPRGGTTTKRPAVNRNMDTVAHFAAQEQLGIEA